MQFQNDVIEWARDHRCHHKWTDTEADPHNARRYVTLIHIRSTQKDRALNTVFCTRYCEKEHGVVWPLECLGRERERERERERDLSFSGFFYSHVGWLMTRKTPQLKEMGAKIDLSDLFNDPILVFQRKSDTVFRFH